MYLTLLADTWQGRDTHVRVRVKMYKTPFGQPRGSMERLTIGGETLVSMTSVPRKTLHEIPQGALSVMAFVGMAVITGGVTGTRQLAQAGASLRSPRPGC